MFTGRYDVCIDSKWRFIIPAEIKDQFTDNKVLLKEGKNCIEVYPAPECSEIKEPNTSFLTKFSKSKTAWRIRIPIFMRNSESFYFNNGKITLVGRGTHLEIWPRAR